MTDTLIDRYVHEVGVHLPAKTRADVALELRSTLQDALAERGLDASKPEDAEGVAALLREFGEPEHFASRYQPERHLIGPAAFPAFRLSYGIAAIVVTIVHLIGLALQINRGGLSFEWWGSFMANYVDNMLLNLGVVTFVFYLLEGFKVIKPSKPDAGWDPRKLPAIKDADRINRTEELVGIIFTIAALLVFNFAPEWIGIITWDEGGPRVFPMLAEGFLAYVPWLTALWLGELALKLLVYRRGRWNRILRIGEFVLQLASIFVVYTILQSAEIIHIPIVNGLVKFGLSVAVAVMVVEAAQQLYALLRGGRPAPSLERIIERIGK
ncbi:MAG: hypothetical protein KIT70_03040 [Anaerolineales bacterium]|nr:MAG: hypothetical protein KIT70_03040 [Anaerolineales bacterium]